DGGWGGPAARLRLRRGRGGGRRGRLPCRGDRSRRHERGHDLCDPRLASFISPSSTRDNLVRAQMRVLIVEDEAKMAGLIRKGLRQEGMAADIASKGEDAVWVAGPTADGASILDLMLPGIDRFERSRR